MQNRPQLFCFTYAGGTTAFFNDIEDDLKGVELVKLEYAGHGERYKEAFYSSFDELAEDMFCRLKGRYNGGIYALFGYSMGSISLVEVLKRILADTSMMPPAHIFLAAHEPHTKSELLGYTSNALDEWVKERTIRFGAVPEQLINNKVFWRTYLPIYRADYTLIGQYDFERLGLKTRTPTTVFYSESDTPLSEMKKWEKYFAGECRFYSYPGTHFFIREHHKEMAGVILSRLGAVL